MIAHDNIYINEIIEYSKRFTPLNIEIDIAKYHEICYHFKDKNIDENTKEIVSAIYTLFYTALNCHKMSKDDYKHLSYYILLGDYISSYCTEILYKYRLFTLLETFTKNTKRVIIDQINNKSQTDYLLNEIIDAL